LFTTLTVHKTELTMVKCAVVRLRALMARQSVQLIPNPLIDLTRGRTCYADHRDAMGIPPNELSF
jgi:hypothetical protein